MARARMTYLSEAERQFVHEQTAYVLEEVGVGYNTPAAIDLLEEAGAEVDRARLRARLPWELVERCLKTCPRQVRLAGRAPGTDVVLGDGSLTFCTDGTGTYMYDDVSGVRSEGTARDLRQVMRLFDALPDVDYAWPSISARDLDPLTAGLEIEAISLDCFGKHLQDEVREVAHVKPLLEIFEAVAGGSLWDRPIFSTVNCTIAPLQHEREMTNGDHGARQGRRAGTGAAHAAPRHDLADDRPRHEYHQHGRAAQRRGAVPACPAGLRSHLGGGSGGHEHAHRRVSVRSAGGGAHQCDLHRDEPLLRTAGDRERRDQRRQVQQPAGGL